MNLIYYIQSVIRSVLPVQDQKDFVRVNNKIGVASVNDQDERETLK